MVARLPQAGVTALAFRPPDSQIVVGGAGQTAVVWSISEQQPVKELPREPKPIRLDGLRLSG